jgi:sulfate adenylyltransferase
MTTTAIRISPVHGGLTAPVNRIDASATADTSLFRVDINETDRTTLYRIADGTLSPITGPMGEDDYASVLSRRAIERDGELWAWTIPVILPVTDAEAEGCQAGTKIGLWWNDEMFGTLMVSSVYDWDKGAFIKAVYGTERMDHPGADLWTSDERTKIVGGEISLVPFQDDRPFAKRVMSPTQTRTLIEENGWEQSVAFQTRNPLHRAHEYALVYGAEKILRETGRKTGVVLNPLVGQLKGDDVPASVRMDTYEALVDNRLLGEGDADDALWSEHGQNLNDQLELIGLDMRMYYGGPAEAVMHAIYRQNLGFTHFIIGRKHADAPFKDGEAIWGDFDAQEIFDNLEGQLAIETVNVGFAAFFEEINRVGLMGDNKDNTRVMISGTKVRAQLCAGESPDPRIMRETTSKILVDYYKTKDSQG